MKQKLLLVAVAGAILMCGSTARAGILYRNETDLPSEADFVNLQFPATLTVPFGQSTGAIYGRLYEAGLTEANGPAGGVVAQLGWGPNGSNPLVDDSGWTWLGTTYNFQVGNDDEYVGSFIAPGFATVLYTFRYSLDGGVTWTLGDLNGAGSNSGLTFEANQLGVLNVTDVPAPGAAALLAMGAISLGRRRRR